jgi:hypothetical protein
MPKYRQTAYLSSIKLDKETDAIVQRKRRQGWKLSPWVRQKIMEEFGNGQRRAEEAN